MLIQCEPGNITIKWTQQVGLSNGVAGLMGFSDKKCLLELFWATGEGRGGAKITLKGWS